MDVISSTPVTLWADFAAPQGLVIPDVGTTFFSLYDGSATPLLVQQALTPGADATGVSISINAIHNVIGPERAFERRRVLVAFAAGGRSYTQELAYRVIDLPPYSTRPNDVRNYLSLNEDELRDDEVDLFAAYMQLQSFVGAELLAAAFDTGTVTELRAERALVLTAATSLFPSLRYRIAQAKTDGSLKFERLKDASAFEGLVQATGDELFALGQGLSGNVSANAVAPVLIALGTVTIDPVTGAAPAAVGG